MTQYNVVNRKVLPHQQHYVSVRVGPASQGHRQRCQRETSQIKGTQQGKKGSVCGGTFRNTESYFQQRQHLGNSWLITSFSLVCNCSSISSSPHLPSCPGCRACNWQPHMEQTSMLVPVGFQTWLKPLSSSMSWIQTHKREHTEGRLWKSCGPPIPSPRPHPVS